MVISRVISRVTILISHIRGLITLLITTHGPPSRVKGSKPKDPSPAPCRYVDQEFYPQACLYPKFLPLQCQDIRIRLKEQSEEALTMSVC